jgi:hypothetical protein
VFEEDAHANLLVCLQMAPLHCDACGDFHISVAVRRTTASRVGMDYDRDVFVGLVAEALAARQGRGLPLSVLIAGAADTAILKLVLDAAVAVGGDAFARRLEVTIVDLCETPLEICRRFAQRHGLALETVRSDIGDYRPDRRFGLVAMHGVLPFFPVDRRLDYMRRIAGWLDEGGLVVSASQIGETSPKTETEAQITQRIAALDAYLASHGGPGALDAEALRARIRRAVVLRRSYPKLFADEDALVAFHAAAGLDLVACRIVQLGADPSPRRYDRRAVVLARPAAA